MWNVYKYAQYDILDDDGYVIYPADTWFLIGNYNTIDSATEIVKHEIYLHNCNNTKENPKFKIESSFEE